jgi:hypothetical protein
MGHLSRPLPTLDGSTNGIAIRLNICAMKIRLRQQLTGSEGVLPSPVPLPQASLMAMESLELFLGGPPLPVTPTQRKGILAQINKSIEETLAQALRLNLPIDEMLVTAILDHAIQEVQQPGYRPLNDGSVRAYLIESAFEDLIQIPSNLFDRVTAADGTENYIPITPETWRECLLERRSVFGAKESAKCH